MGRPDWSTEWERRAREATINRRIGWGRQHHWREGDDYADAITATADDGTQIALSGSVTIPGTAPGFGVVSESLSLSQQARRGTFRSEPCARGIHPPSGSDPAFKLTSPLSGGLDIENNPEVFDRISARLQTPPRGGVAEDYRLWAGAVDGVVDVFVYPKRSGVGTVDVVVVSGGSGQGRVPSAAVVAAAQAAISAKAPPGIEGLYARAPAAPNGFGRNVQIRVVPSENSAFDWDDGGTPLVVSGFSAGPPATITIVGSLPQSLTDAVDFYKAAPATRTPPRLQVLSTVNPVVPINVPIGVVDHSGSVLTLENAPDGWAPPSNGDQIFAYGPVVATIAAGALALVDSLGPSRVRGFADNITPWQDKLTISGLTAVAEDAIDADGTQLIEEVPPGGITINGVAADVQGSDSINGPELLYLCTRCMDPVLPA